VTGPIEASGGVSVGPDGRIYLADFGPALGPAGGQNVYRVTPQGKVELFATGFGGASGNHFGQDGFLYQSDIGRGEVYRVAPDGQRTRIAKDLKDPVGVTPGPGGVVYVAQCGAGIVSRIQPDGTVETVAQGKPLHCPNGLILGPDGALYTSNFFDGSVVRIALPSGAMTVLATVPGGGNGHLTARNGRLYVASFRGNRIFEVTLQGAVCPLAGSGAAATADGEPSHPTATRCTSTPWPGSSRRAIPRCTPTPYAGSRACRSVRRARRRRSRRADLQDTGPRWRRTRAAPICRSAPWSAQESGRGRRRRA
jgi:sugar lactone lactonase YvrE